MESNERVELGIDGNCGFALLGQDLQDGEAEFVEIEDMDSLDSKLCACKKALKVLKLRLGRPDLGYYFGVSHPYGEDVC